MWDCSHCGLLALLLSLLIITDSVTAQSNAIALNYRIREEREPGTYIGNVKYDSGLASQYSQAEMDEFKLKFLTQPNYIRYFSLDAASGELETEDRLDRESICPRQQDCTLDLQVAMHKPGRFHLIQVTITVLDLNDNDPEFSQSHMTTSLPESTAPKVLFPIQEALDQDSPANGVVRYELLDPSGIFWLKVTNNTVSGGSVDLHLVLEDGLDREAEDAYNLKVVAYDGGVPARSGSVTIDITVVDENDNAPTFHQSVYEVTVPEDAEVGMDDVLIQVQARDPDDQSNGDITYSFSSKTNSFYGDTFGIDAKTGEIFIKEPLDHEQMSLYNLGVTAQDNGPNSFPTHAKVFVHVLNINDNRPEINVDPMSDSGLVEVKENSDGGMFVASVSMLDADKDEVVCKLSDKNFVLEHLVDTDYKILTLNTLDRERKAQYEIVLRCHDKGNPPLSASSSVMVHVVDENDNTPMFQQQAYEKEVEENNRENEIIMQVIATDPDESWNGDVRYSIDTDLLNIDPKSGVITAKMSFDREDRDLIEFYVTATDLGVQPRYSSVPFRLTIGDMDDEPAVFTEYQYTFSVTENLPARTEVGTVTANDRDLPPYNRFSYKLDNTTSNSDLFGIDGKSGVIYAKKSLDREQQHKYELTVLAISKSTPRRRSTALVSIYVRDKNDNAPHVIFPKDNNNTVYVSNKVPVGYRVTTIRARDPDHLDGGRLNFTITAGDDNFRILSDTGEILVNGDLSSIDNEVFTLHIRVEDQGTPRKMAVTVINIVVNKSVAYPGPGYSHQASVPLSPTHLAIVICVVVGSSLIAMCLVAAILVVRKRNKYAKNNQEESFYVGTKTDGVPASTSVGSSDKGEPFSITREESKMSDMTDITYTPAADPLYKTTGTDPLAQERDTDSGCADVSHTESQGSSDDSDLPHRHAGIKTVNGQGATVMLKCYHPRSHSSGGLPATHQLPPHPQQAPPQPHGQQPLLPKSTHPPRRQGSFSEWLQSESYNLQKKGNMYRVNDHNPTGSVKKSVRFSEPQEVQENDYSLDPTVVRSPCRSPVPAAAAPGDYYVNCNSPQSPSPLPPPVNVGRTSTFQTPVVTTFTPKTTMQLQHAQDGSLV